MRPIGIYHQIDLEVLDAAASLRAKGVAASKVTEEFVRMAQGLGINPKTADKRTRPARKAWFDSESPIVERAAALFSAVSRTDQIALHTAVLVRAYPFFLDVTVQVGTSIRLGTAIRQATIRDRLSRLYGRTGSVYQGVQKVLQTLVSWRILRKTAQTGTYDVERARPIQFEVSELLVASILEAGERDALPVSGLGNHPATFPFTIPAWDGKDSPLLHRFAEGSGGLFVQLSNR